MTPSSPPVRMVVFSGPHSALLIRPSGPDMLILMSFVCSSLFAATSTMCNAAGDAHEGIGRDHHVLVALRERHRADGLLELVREVARPGLGVPHLARGVRGTGHERLGVLADVARPHRAVVADVRANAVAVVGVPQRGVVILGAREQEVALLVVLDERQRPG